VRRFARTRPWRVGQPPNPFGETTPLGGFSFRIAALGCLCVGSDSVGNENKPSQTGPLIYLSVEGRLDDAVKKAGASGGKVLEEKQQIGPHGYRAVVVDSEGNRIALHSSTA
jgi:predicted enzyme related to lactoylglutathione lyase